MRTDEENKRSLLYRIGRDARPKLDKLIAADSEVGNPPVFDPELFPFTRVLEANWEAIRAEAEKVVLRLDEVPPLHDISPDHRRIAQRDKWRSFFLWGYGYRSEENCARCPETTKLLTHVPGLNSAFFSILKPGTHIPRHRGVTKHLLTCHLGLIVPPKEQRCEMQVDEQVVRWEEGKCLVFDDTYHHEVWNEGGVRVVLLIQFKRPSRLPGRLVGDLFLGAIRRSPFVQEARRNFSTWDGAMKSLDTPELETPE